jgi:hypothetical protein
MREHIRSERQIRLEKFLNKIEATHYPTHLVRPWTKTLIELYLGHLRIEDPAWPNSEITLQDAAMHMHGVWLHMYVHTPVQIEIRKALQKLAAEDYAEVKRILEETASDEFGEKIKSQIQTRNSSHKHKKRAYEELQEAIVRGNPMMGHKEFERELRTHIGKGVIVSMDDALNEIRLNNDERIFNISGLKHRLSKLRKVI